MGDQMWAMGILSLTITQGLITFDGTINKDIVTIITDGVVTNNKIAYETIRPDDISILKLLCLAEEFRMMNLLLRLKNIKRNIYNIYIYIYRNGNLQN